MDRAAFGWQDDPVRRQAQEALAEGSLMRRPLFLACLCLVIALAIGRILTGADTGDNGGLPPDGSPVRITGRIDTRTSETIILKSISIIQNDQTYSYSGKLQCELTNAQEHQNLKLGQRIALEGIFSQFEAATNPGEFDVRAYYAGKGIGGRVRKAQVLATGEDYSLLRETLYRFRLVLHDRLARVFPAKEASVMQTLLLGEKEELDAEVKALYQKNGIAHILSISGLHITLLGMGCYRLLKRLGAPVRAAAAGGVIVLLLYGVMVGMSVSASRAIGMYLLRMLGLFVGRTYDMLTAVGLMAVLLILQEPERLGDVSFLMSFGAVLGICILTPVFAGGSNERDTDAELEAGGISGFGEDLGLEEKRGFGRKGGLGTMPDSDEMLDFDAERGMREGRRKYVRMPGWLRTVVGILGDSAYERNKYREGWRKVLYKGIRRVLAAGKSGFVTSAGVTLFILPVQLWFFYEIPVYSVLLNLLVLPLMSMVMAGGIFSLIPGCGIIGTLDCLILWWYEWICERFQELPGAVWTVGRPAVWQIVIYYAGLFVLILVRYYREERKKRGTYVPESGRGDGQRRGICQAAHRFHFTNGEKGMGSVIRAGGCSGICSVNRQHFFGKLWHAWQGMIVHGNGFYRRIATMAILGLLVFLLTGKSDHGSRITFLDVGQGDGIMIETAQGTYLFDCGSTSRKKVGEYVLKPYLKSRGICSLRAVFVSHPDEDHMNGVVELLENGGKWGISVEQLFLPAIQEADREEAFAGLLAAAERAGTAVTYIKCGDEIRDRQLRLLCLHPEENTNLADANAYSECFYVEVYAKETGQHVAVDTMAADAMASAAMGESAADGRFAAGVVDGSRSTASAGENGGISGAGEGNASGGRTGKVSILLTGDVEGEGERQLIQELQTLQEAQESREQRRQGAFTVDILKVAHHGSGYSTSSEFLAAASSTAAIISCGRNNSYGHPHAGTLQRLEDAGVPWYCTTDYGALTVTVDSHGKRWLRGYSEGQ